MTEFNDGFPKPRVCAGVETDSFESPLNSSTKSLWQKPDNYKHGEIQESPLHFIIEHVDPITGVRFCRTYFLSALMANEGDYMKDVKFYTGDASRDEL